MSTRILRGRAARPPITRASSGSATTGHVTWAGVDAGLWVAFGSGSHFGRVDAVEGGRFRAYSDCGQDLGVFATLAEAERAVEAAAQKLPAQM